MLGLGFSSSNLLVGMMLACDPVSTLSLMVAPCISKVTKHSFDLISVVACFVSAPTNSSSSELVSCVIAFTFFLDQHHF